MLHIQGKKQRLVVGDLNSNIFFFFRKMDQIWLVHLFQSGGDYPKNQILAYRTCKAIPLVKGLRASSQNLLEPVVIMLRSFLRNLEVGELLDGNPGHLGPTRISLFNWYINPRWTSHVWQPGAKYTSRLSITFLLAEWWNFNLFRGWESLLNGKSRN